MLIRSTDGRVLLCQLTYKRDCDLPGGVVEVTESPQLAVAREVKEELRPRRRRRCAAAHGLATTVGRLGRRHLPGLRRRRARRRDRGGDRPPGARDPVGRFFTLAEVREHCADFTARRIEAALRNVPGNPSASPGRRTPRAGGACPAEPRFTATCPSRANRTPSVIVARSPTRNASQPRCTIFSAMCALSQAVTAQTTTQTSATAHG